MHWMWHVKTEFWSTQGYGSISVLSSSFFCASQLHCNVIIVSNALLIIRTSLFYQKKNSLFFFFSFFLMQLGSKYKNQYKFSIFLTERIFYHVHQHKSKSFSEANFSTSHCKNLSIYTDVSTNLHLLQAI